MLESEKNDNYNFYATIYWSVKLNIKYWIYKQQNLLYPTPNVLRHDLHGNFMAMLHIITQLLIFLLLSILSEISALFMDCQTGYYSLISI